MTCTLLECLWAVLDMPAAWWEVVHVFYPGARVRGMTPDDVSECNARMACAAVLTISSMQSSLPLL